MAFYKRFQASLESLYTLPENASYVVAYSGGVDSHVLLHCCKQLNLPLRAVHVHHGLQTSADDWVNHCQKTCNNLNIPLDVVYVDAQQKRGQSPEESARNARYQALQENLTANDCLLTAQHLDDQAETFLLQLFRTASTAGLSAMPGHRQLGEFAHLRPLLSFTREEIVDFAKQHLLQWIEDPSNLDVTYNRNFIRKNVLPLLKDRWPAIVLQLSTVASLQSSNLQVLEDMAAIDLANVILSPVAHTKTSLYKIVSVLSITRLKHLTSARLLNVLRYWIRTTMEAESLDTCADKSTLTRKLLEEIERTLVCSQQDSNPVVNFNGFEFRKFQNELYLLKSRANIHQNELNNVINWKPSTSLILSPLNIQIKSLKTTAGGLNKRLLEETLKITFRKGGEYFHPAGRQHSQRLKKLLQEANIPPWDRETIPLLYYNDELIAVVGFWMAKDYVVADGEEGWVVDVDFD